MYSVLFLLFYKRYFLFCKHRFMILLYILLLYMFLYICTDDCLMSNVDMTKMTGPYKRLCPQHTTHT